MMDARQTSYRFAGIELETQEGRRRICLILLIARIPLDIHERRKHFRDPTGAMTKANAVASHQCFSLFTGQRHLRGVRVPTSKEIHTLPELSAAAGGSVVPGFAKGDPACAKQSSFSNKKEYVRFAGAARRHARSMSKVRGGCFDVPAAICGRPKQMHIRPVLLLLPLWTSRESFLDLVQSRSYRPRSSIDLRA
jgi:hypothetical protein